MPSYISVILSQKQLLENLLSCSTLINNSKEKRALEKGGYEDFQVHGVPPNCARYNSCKIKEEGNLNQTKETVRKKTLLKLVRHKERKKTHQKEEGGSQSREGKGEK